MIQKVRIPQMELVFFYCIDTKSELFIITKLLKIFFFFLLIPNIIMIFIKIFIKFVLKYFNFIKIIARENSSGQTK